MHSIRPDFVGQARRTEPRTPLFSQERNSSFTDPTPRNSAGKQECGEACVLCRSERVEKPTVCTPFRSQTTTAPPTEQRPWHSVPVSPSGQLTAEVPGTRCRQAKPFPKCWWRQLRLPDRRGVAVLICRFEFWLSVSKKDHSSVIHQGSPENGWEEIHTPRSRSPLCCGIDHGIEPARGAGDGG